MNMEDAQRFSRVPVVLFDCQSKLQTTVRFLLEYC